MRIASVRVALLALVAAWPTRARGDEAPISVAAPVPYWVDFEAGRVELDPELMKLELSRDVRIVVDRYRLTSERLTLRRTARGVEIDGEGRISFCPCENAPLSFGFQRAIVAPPTDLLVQGATIRIGDVPVFWTPVLWLRAPDRWGLLPPRLAWRAEEGLLVGTGVHLPLGGRRGATLSFAEVSAGAYLRGGFELETRLVTPTTTSRVRWDHLDDSLLATDAHGSAVSREGATLAFRVDSIRGARGRSATLDLEPASKRFDHARVGLSGSGRGLVGSLGVIAAGERGAAVDSAVAAGPIAQLSLGGALGSGSSADADVEASTLRQRGLPSSSLVVHHAQLAAAASAGPLLLSVRLDQHAVFQGREAEAQASAFAGARGQASLPLVRAFGGDDDPLVHRVEPFIDAGFRVAERRGQSGAVFRAFEAAPPGRLALGSVGAASGLGRYGAREALEVELRGGGAYDIEQAAAIPAVAAAVAADGEWTGAQAECAARPDSDRELFVTARTRAGRLDGLHIESHVTGGLDDSPIAARALASDHFPGTIRPYLDRPGWSAGSRLGIPWTRELASQFATEADVSEGRFMAWSAAVGYRHPCGCFAVVGRTGQRVGRDGLDAEVTLDLMP